MGDLILRQGDNALFPALYPPANVTAPRAVPFTTTSSPDVRIEGSPICLEGDERKLTPPAAPYTALAFTVPGLGSEAVDKLAPDQTSTDVYCNGKKLLLKGGQFSARFTPATHAQTPPPSVSDTKPDYEGRGRFETTNTTVRAS